MGIMVRERAQEVALMEQKRPEDCVRGELLPEPQLPCGWEKCLDLKSGLMYFKDWNSGTLTYRDPRQAVATQRIGLLSISLSAENPPTRGNAIEGVTKKFKRAAKGSHDEQWVRRPWEDEANDQSLDLTLNLPGSSHAAPRNSQPRPSTSNQEGSVCTMEKVRSALARSQWLQPPRKRASPSATTNLSDALSTALSLLSPLPSSSSRESNSPAGPHSKSASSPTTSRCSSECFTSPSVMSYQGDDEEVRSECRDTGARSQGLARETKGEGDGAGEVMVAVGCRSCLMYVMLSKSHPCCPKCGNADVLLQLPAAPSPKRQRVTATTPTSPTWSWCTA